MHPDLAKLVVLQAHDIEAKRLRDQMASLSRQVAALETNAKATVGQRAVVLDLIAKEEALRRKEESEIADLRAKLESMERGEALDAQKALADEAVANAAATFERERIRATETTAADHTALLEIERLRTALRAEIIQSETGETSLANYDRIARSKGTAVSEALNQKCTACQMMVRPQRWNDLRDNSADSESAHTILSCENCGRMLYYDPARDSPERKPVQVESIAAQIVRSL